MAQKRRYELQEMLENICPKVSEGKSKKKAAHVYFSPPDGVHLVYPCIIYERMEEDVQRADDIGYIRQTGYMVTCIDTDPDSSFYKDILDLPIPSRYDRHSDANGLSHDYLVVYY